MRDLKRPNAKLPAYKMLAELGFEVFTPLKWKLSLCRGRRVRTAVPVMHDLLFVHDSKCNLEPVVARTQTLQFRFVRNGFCEPMIVRDEDMNRFVRAVSDMNDVCYYAPDEISHAMCGRDVRIVGGPLDGYEGKLLTVRGSKVKRLIVDIPALLVAGIAVNPEYVQLL